jgi:hypothetical protein
MQKMIISMLEFLMDDMFCGVHRTHFPTNHRLPYKKKIYPSPCRPFPIFLWGWVYKRAYQRQHNTADHVVSINYPNFANWVLLIYPKELEKKQKQKQLSRHHSLTFTLNLTPIVKFLPDNKKRQTTSILPLCNHYATVPNIELYFITDILHSSLQCVYRLFAMSPYSEYYYIQSRIHKDLSHPSLSKNGWEDSNTFLERILSIAYR